MTTQYRYFRVQQLGDETIVTLTVKDFRNQVANVEMKSEFVKYAQEDKPKHLIVNFENVALFSTELIGTMLSVKKLRGEDGELKLCCMEEILRDVFRLLRLDGTVFEIHDTVNNARKAF